MNARRIFFLVCINVSGDKADHSLHSSNRLRNRNAIQVIALQKFSSDKEPFFC